MKQNFYSSQGFVALISAIIISAILLLVVTTLSFTGYYGRFNRLLDEFKERGTVLAEACANDALLRLAHERTYSGNATTTVGNGQCYIGRIDTTIPGEMTLHTRAIDHETYTNLKITVRTSDLILLSWEEVPVF